MHTVERFGMQLIGMMALCALVFSLVNMKSIQSSRADFKVLSAVSDQDGVYLTVFVPDPNFHAAKCLQATQQALQQAHR